MFSDIVVTTCWTGGMRFVDNHCRLDVAFTRGVNAFFIVCNLDAMSSQCLAAKTHEEDNDTAESGNKDKSSKSDEVEKYLQQIAGFYTKEQCVYLMDFHDLSNKYVLFAEATSFAEVQQGIKCYNCQQSSYLSTQYPNENVSRPPKTDTCKICNLKDYKAVNYP